MKVAVSSYSFQKLLKDGTYNQFSIIEKAKEIGFGAIEFVDINPHDGTDKKEYAKKLREECVRVGMEISAFTFGADFLNGSDGDTKTEIERVKSQIDIAEILGAKVIRHDATSGIEGKTFEMVLPVLADACREVTEYAQKKGIKTTVENHGFFCQDSSRVLALYSAVNHDNFGLLCDMGNFLCVDENPLNAVSKVAPFASYVHAKDFHVLPAEGTDPGAGFFRSREGNYLRGAIIGHGNVPVKACLYVLKRAGYDGYVTIEFEGLEDNILALTTGLENLKRYIKEIE